MTETTYWICDTCGERIERVDDGWVEWIILRSPTTSEDRGRDLRLVHHLPASPKRKEPGCQMNGHQEYTRDGGILHDLPLSCFVGPDGLMRLLRKLTEGELPKNALLEMIKRLHIPGYEVAQRYFDEAIRAGVLELNNMPFFPFQDEIDEILRYVAEKYPEMT